VIETKKLQTFSPLDSLSPSGLERVAEQMNVRVLRPGEMLFLKGDTDTPIYFLLEGRIDLRSDDHSAPLIIQAGSDAANMPLSRLKPRRYFAVAKTAASVAWIDEIVLDDLLTADHTASYEVSVIEGEDPEWMFRLFTSPAFKNVPSGNLAALFGHLQPVDVEAGQIIIRQGEPGEHYYMIRRGRARVLRAFNGEEPAQVAELGSGDAFGEEALLSGEPRNATIEMIESGQLMRLALDDFNTLLKAALVRFIDLTAAAVLIGRGARFLDVRSEAEFAEFSLPGSVNMPLSRLRQLTYQLEPKRQYIAVCQFESRSSAAAFLLSQQGYDVTVLAGGLDAIRNMPHESSFQTGK